MPRRRKREKNKASLNKRIKIRSEQDEIVQYVVADNTLNRRIQCLREMDPGLRELLLDGKLKRIPAEFVETMREAECQRTNRQMGLTTLNEQYPIRDAFHNDSSEQNIEEEHNEQYPYTHPRDNYRVTDTKDTKAARRRIQKRYDLSCPKDILNFMVTNQTVRMRAIGMSLMRVNVRLLLLSGFYKEIPPWLVHDLEEAEKDRINLIEMRRLKKLKRKEHLQKRRAQRDLRNSRQLKDTEPKREVATRQQTHEKLIQHFAKPTIDTINIKLKDEMNDLIDVKPVLDIGHNEKIKLEVVSPEEANVIIISNKMHKNVNNISPTNLNEEVIDARPAVSSVHLIKEETERNVSQTLKVESINLQSQYDDTIDHLIYEKNEIDSEFIHQNNDNFQSQADKKELEPNRIPKYASGNILINEVRTFLSKSDVDHLNKVPANIEIASGKPNVFKNPQQTSDSVLSRMKKIDARMMQLQQQKMQIDEIILGHQQEKMSIDQNVMQLQNERIQLLANLMSGQATGPQAVASTSSRCPVNRCDSTDSSFPAKKRKLHNTERSTN